MAEVPIPDDCILHDFERVKRRGKKRWKSSDGDRLYEWDSLHGEIEMYNCRGKHLGVLDCDGTLIKAAVKGRSIDV